MNFEKKWTILANLLMELQKRGQKIPANIIRDLRSAKTIIQVLKTDPTQLETNSRTEKYLRSVESYCIFTAEKLGTDTVNEWLEKLKEIRITNKNKKNQTSFRFVPGIPKDNRWLRVKTSKDAPQEEVKKLVNESNLHYKIQKNGYILVYGNEKFIDSFIKKMTKQFRGEINS